MNDYKDACITKIVRGMMIYLNNGEYIFFSKEEISKLKKELLNK